MAAFRTLIPLLRNASPRSRVLSLPLLSSPALSGPLFLSSPPWKLAQSATPLHFRDQDLIFPKKLIRIPSFPIDLRLGSASEVARDVIKWKKSLESDGEVRGVGGEEKFLNLPNLISISRMVSGPFIGWMIMNEWYLSAFCGLAISGLTDWLDGFVARRMNINSVFGSYLDPLADKVLIGCVALAMVEEDLLHSGLVGLIVFRDVALVSGAVYRRASSLGWKWKSWSEFINLGTIHREKIEPLFISKVNTVFQLLLVAAALLQPELGSEDTQQYITYLSWLVASTTVASSAAYGAQFLRHRTTVAA